MPNLPRLALLAVLALLLTVSTSFASEASDAYKEAKVRATAADRAETEEDRAAQRADLQDWARSKSRAILAKNPGRMDMGHVGRMQTVAGLYDDAIATLEKAIADPRKTKYESYIYLFYARALIGGEQWDKAYSAFEKMKTDYGGEKNTKIAAMSVGMAMRTQRRWKESAAALDVSLKMKNAAALKPLVNSLLLDGQKDAAIAAIEYAIEKAGEGGADPAHQILLGVAKNWGEVVPYEIVDFAPGPAPDLKGKVVVMGFWNVSAGTLRWTMESLQYFFDSFPPVDGVETLAVTTYYKKNPDTGMIEEDMTPEAEQTHGLAYRNQWGFQGQLAYLKDREAMQALGVSAFPCIVVIGKDGKLLYSHTINREDPTEIDVIADIIKKAAGK
jgi:tetratricopeptide (TPR) repeat protein